MRTSEILEFKSKIFTIDDIAKQLKITLPSAKILASRYVKKGILIRLKRNYYITKLLWEKLTTEDLFEIANLLQTPSYISLTTALSYYGITTQQIRNVIESIALKRKVTFEIQEL